MRLLLCAQGEWNIHACGVLAQRLHNLGCQVFVSHRPLPQHINLPFSVSWQGAVLPMPPDQLAISDLARHVDAIGIFASPEVTTQFQEVHKMACNLAGQHSVPIFSGPAQPLSGDQLEADLLGRLDCNLICLHGPMESEVLGELTRNNEHASPQHVELGLWQLPPRVTNNDSDAEAARSFVFVEQQNFPASSANRKKLIAQLERLALILPNWKVIIQPDYGQPEDAKKLSEYSFSRLLLTKNLKPRPELPSNLIFGSAEGIPRILADATIVATLSSTAAIACVAWGKQLLVLADYGFSTSAQSQLWMGSGLTGRLAAITSGEELLELPAVHKDWLHSMGGSINNGGAERLLTTLQNLCEARSA